MTKRNTTISAIGALMVTALIAACGGGGGGAMNPPPTSPPKTSPTPTISPTPTPSPGLTGNMQVATGGTVGSFTYGPAANATIVFSCGCSTQAGTATADGTGTFTLVANSTPTPSAPDPTYTIVPGRNYIVVATTAGGAEAWTTQFAGNNPARNQYLDSNVSDVYTAAVSLYVFNNSPSGTTAFDDWNFNATIRLVYIALKTSPNGAETTLLNDIAARSAANKTLFPGAPSWNMTQMSSTLIKTDLAAVKTSGDATIPTPCPGGEAGCTGTPTP